MNVIEGETKRIPEGHQRPFHGIGLALLLHLLLQARKKGSRHCREPLLELDRGDRIRTCDLVLPKRKIQPDAYSFFELWQWFWRMLSGPVLSI
jgi:hypothetical protein